MKTYFDQYLETRMQDPEFKEAYEAERAKRTVYLVGWEDVETHSVEHVCASKDTAKKRFGEIQRMLLWDAYKSKSLAIKKGRSGDWAQEHIEDLEKTTFEDPEIPGYSMPFWSVYTVED